MSEIKLANRIVARMGCKTCTPGLRGEMSAGLSADGRLQIECDLHGTIANFDLAEPFDMSKITCVVCGKKLDGKEHMH